MNIVQQFFNWLKKWFWDKPTNKPEPLKATDVLNRYICIKYHEQWINLRRSELQAWNRMSRKDRRAMGQRFRQLEKKGKLMFVEINGKMTCIQNLN
jgi:hypothetical protein